MAKNRLDFQAHLSRHPHDISAGYTSSLTTGPLVPQYWHILSPGDTIYYNTKMFVRFKDIVTAFLGEVDVHVDYFFVPLQMLYLPFGQIFAQTIDFVSSAFSPASTSLQTDKFPLLRNFAHMGSSGIEEGLGYAPETVGTLEAYGKESCRLLDALGMNPLGAVAYQREGMTDRIPRNYCMNPYVAPWAFAAYQAIYQHFYRNDEFEKLSVSSYNFDQYYNQVGFSNGQMSALRYVQRPSDYFTSVRVSPIASAVNELGNSETRDGGTFSGVLSRVNDYLGGSYYMNADKDGSDTSVSFNVTQTAPESFLSWSTANIRTLFAVDKFLRVYGRAGKTYDDQILAHFGVKVPHDVKHQATKLASYKTAIGSDPVYSTSTVGSSDGSVLGQVGGQASGEIRVVGEGNGRYAEKFTAPVHGVFMAVAYAVTKPRYLFTFNKLNLITERLKFPIPEYDKLGSQPIYAFEAYPHLFGSGSADYGVHRIGWQNRYAEFKQKFNRASLNYLYSTYEQELGAENNAFSAWVLSRMPYGNLGDQEIISDELVSSRSLFERPDALNSVMAVPYDMTWHDEYFAHPHMILDTDPMVTEFMCDAKLVSWMSETGEPDL